jgi:hypothetical protein
MIFNRGIIATIVLSFAMILSVVAPVNSYAVSCSGAGCNGKDPAATGCNQNAYLAKRYPFYDKYGIILSPYSSSTPYMDIYYSRSCGTNWIRVTNNPYGGTTYKEIQVATPNGFLETESDWGYGSSYSMMVYAPGSTAIRVWSRVKNTSNVTQATTDYILMR